MQHEGSSNFRADLTRMVQNSIKEKLEDVVNSELENVGEITPQTWKIVAHNITKSVKDSPAMYSLLEGVQSMLFSTIENVISNIENEPISEFHNTQSLIQRSVNDGWYQGHTNMRLYEQLALDTAQQRPLKVRKQALTILHQSVLNEVMSTNYWPQIRLHLRENLCEENDEVFNISIKIHAKLLQSSSHVCIKEGFINLVEGMQMYYSKIYQNSLPNFKTGIDFNVLIHQHLCQIMYLILEATKEMPKNWLRYGERRVEQIVTAFVTLLAMHTDESRLDLPRDILYPFHIIAILDPRADATLSGKRRTGRPKLRWLDDVQDDLVKAGIKRWRRRALEREDWAAILKEVKAKLKGLSLASFLAAVASTPCGLFALAQDDEILQDLLSLLLQSSFVPWENPEFRCIMSLTTILPQAVPVLTEESHRILARALCNIWCEYENPVALMTGSDRKQNESIQHFINIIFTFALSLQGIMALLTESETSSEITLVDAEPHPTTLSELLIFDSSTEPSHYVALLTLRALTTNMDVCLHLNASTKFQEKLLKLQSENITSDAEPIEAEELRSRSSSSNEPIIIDQCSILRHQILVATYAIGGPTERILPQVVFDKEHEDNIPTLFCSLPPPSLASLRSTARQRRSTRLKGQTDFQRFLQDTKQGLHDANWLSHARRAYKTSRNEEVKAFVLLELIDQVTKLNSNAETLSDLQLESEDNELLPEEKLGIQAVIRYGITCHLLQENQQNEDNLAQLLYLSHSLTKHRKNETFQGFDWFVGTVFLLCGGNMERCRSCLGNVAALPVGPFLWPALAAAQDKASSNLSHRSTMFGHILELLVKVELPLAFSALQAHLGGSFVSSGWLSVFGTSLIGPKYAIGWSSLY
ncbi:hypothetical protein ANN_18246 [Periplaneta americana]|uniref:Uncharacterized protein n=1 Tax=Periplaneta americana TaxID=6978 RepID=A0ABQ8SQB9_PERAM|nr:hypothetical protein ANN_18246 [Periplaneta americana]